MLIPPAKPRGDPRTIELRSILNAIVYILCAGYAWLLLPHDFPKWQIVSTSEPSKLSLSELDNVSGGVESKPRPPPMPPV